VLEVVRNMMKGMGYAGLASLYITNLGRRQEAYINPMATEVAMELSQSI
jgi:hypothetical protein